MGNVDFEDRTESRSYRFHILIIKEEEGDFSVVALNLPGVGSIGDNEEEALAHFREAARGVLESYTESGDPIPWKAANGTEDIPDNAKQKWIIVDA